jgi:hypothetical protein
MQLLEAQSRSLKTIHSQVIIPYTKYVADIVYGFQLVKDNEHRDAALVAIEIKSTNTLNDIKNDLDKLMFLIKNNLISAGVFVSIGGHFEDETVLEKLKQQYQLDAIDKGNNNFLQSDVIDTSAYRNDGCSKNWDALFIALRKKY